MVEGRGSKSVVRDSLADASNVVDLRELLKRFAFNMISLGVDPCCLDPSWPVSPLNKAFDTTSELEIHAKRGAVLLLCSWFGNVKKWVRSGSDRRNYSQMQGRKSVHTLRESWTKTEKPGEDLLPRLRMANNNEEVMRDITISFIMAGSCNDMALLVAFLPSIYRARACETREEHYMQSHPSSTQQCMVDRMFIVMLKLN
ncbi:hypothetical protein V6N13_127270 [Hibiscus sabdariffa]|uniref:Uncharacterized protein n=1 Tax=Hibiscus sabdariffa TaxID=183260 RepID=A0ABR2RD00_9ROSI